MLLGTPDMSSKVAWGIPRTVLEHLNAVVELEI
jgi:hypothetical protein